MKRLTIGIQLTIPSPIKVQRLASCEDDLPGLRRVTREQVVDLPLYLSHRRAGHLRSTLVLHLVISTHDLGEHATRGGRSLRYYGQVGLWLDSILL